MDMIRFEDYGLGITPWITGHEWSPLYSHCIRGENALAIWPWDNGGKPIKTHSGSKNWLYCSGWRAPMAEKGGLSCCFFWKLLKILLLDPISHSKWPIMKTWHKNKGHRLWIQIYTWVEISALLWNWIIWRCIIMFSKSSAPLVS